MNLLLNWKQQLFKVNYSSHTVTLHLSSGSATTISGNIYDGLKEFDHFNGDHNKVAVKRSIMIKGEKYIFFDGLGFFGRLSDCINPPEVPVRVWSSKSKKVVHADTAGDHMLIGQRRWQAARRNSSRVLIRTLAFESPRNLPNKIGMWLMGARYQLKVWEAYFQNIQDNYSSVSVSTARHKTARYRPSVRNTNPWKPFLPYPGVEVP